MSTYEVNDVVCDYGVYEDGELKLILNSRSNAEQIKTILETDEAVSNAVTIYNGKRPTTPQEFANAMRNARFGGDPEEAHLSMDELMCKLLTNLGYGDGVKVFNDAYKWYS